MHINEKKNLVLRNFQWNNIKRNILLVTKILDFNIFPSLVNHILILVSIIDTLIINVFVL